MWGSFRYQDLGQLIEMSSNEHTGEIGRGVTGWYCRHAHLSDYHVTSWADAETVFRVTSHPNVTFRIWITRVRGRRHAFAKAVFDALTFPIPAFRVHA